MPARGLYPAEGMANTTANTKRDQKMGRGAERKAEELSAGKGLSSAAQLTSEETLEVRKKMQEDKQSSCLWTPSENSFHIYFC